MLCRTVQIHIPPSVLQPTHASKKTNVTLNCCYALPYCPIRTPPSVSHFNIPTPARTPRLRQNVVTHRHTVRLVRYHRLCVTNGELVFLAHLSEHFDTSLSEHFDTSKTTVKCYVLFSDTYTSVPVSYTHLTLPTSSEV